MSNAPTSITQHRSKTTAGKHPVADGTRFPALVRERFPPLLPPP
eukprot:COSAG02_NODE_21613_length_781_cov_1.266862_1_plen_43_part_01